MRLYFRFILIAILSIIAIPFFLNAYASAEGGTGTITVSVPMTLKPPVTAKEYSGISINLVNGSDNFETVIYSATTDTITSVNSDSAQTITLTAKIPLTNVNAGTNYKVITDVIPGTGSSTYPDQPAYSEIFSIDDPNQNVDVTIDGFTNDNYDKLAAAGGTVATANKGKTTCSIDGIGWIVCPVIRFLSSISDSAFKYLSTGFLEVKAITFSDSNNGIREAWGSMRNIANVAFVIAFLIIIFSQITSIGMTNYGVKKLLPRLIIAAILVNISYFICQILVDISNILGYSFNKMFEDMYNNLSTSSTINTMSGFWSGDKFWANMAGGILATAGSVALGWLYLSALIPLILTAVIALVMIFFILVARQALIILLVIISPLAFVAYLLPNTEGLYKKWQKIFISLLIVFPIVGLIFGASKLASGILFGVFSSTTGSDETLGQIMAACVLVLPLFAVPALLKKSLDGIGGIGATINGLGKAGQGLANKAYEGSKLDQMMKYKDAQTAKRQALIRSGLYDGSKSRNPLNRIRGLASRGHRTFNDSSLSGDFGNQSTLQGYALGDKEKAELLSGADSLLDHSGISAAQQQDLAEGRNVEIKDKDGRVLRTLSGSDKYMREAAIKRAMSIATVKDAESLIKSSGTMDAAQRRALKSTMVSSGITNKATHLGGKTLDDIEQGRLGKSATEIEAGLDQAVINNINDGKYSVEKIAANETDSLKRIQRVVSAPRAFTGEIKDDAYRKLFENMDTAMSDSRIENNITDAQKEVLHRLIGK